MKIGIDITKKETTFSLEIIFTFHFILPLTVITRNKQRRNISTQFQSDRE